MLLGAHVPSNDPLSAAQARSCDGVVQIFASSPRQWRPPKRLELDEMHAAGYTVVLHAPYLINLASPTPEVRSKSIALLQATLEAAADAGAAGVVVHGGQAGADEPQGAGFARWREALARLTGKVPVWVENTATGKNACARTIEQIAQLWSDAVPYSQVPVGFCFDTCHGHAGDARTMTTAGMARLVGITGGVDLLHINDSLDTADAGRDRHASIGAGQIELAPTLRETIEAAGAPLAVVETPGGADGQARDILTLRKILSLP